METKRVSQYQDDVVQIFTIEEVLEAAKSEGHEMTRAQAKEIVRVMNETARSESSTMSKKRRNEVSAQEIVFEGNYGSNGKDYGKASIVNGSSEVVDDVYFDDPTLRIDAPRDIESFRQVTGYSQEEVAKILNVSRDKVGRVEREEQPFLREWIPILEKELARLGV